MQRPALPASCAVAASSSECGCHVVLRNAPVPSPLLRSGRLFNQIRSREGLAYAVSGGWRSTPVDHPGLFLASAETAQPAALLAALRSALEAAAAEEPPAEEVQRAQQAREGVVLGRTWSVQPSLSCGPRPFATPSQRGPPCLFHAWERSRGPPPFPPHPSSPRRRPSTSLSSPLPPAPPSSTASSPLTCWESPRTTCSGGVGAGWVHSLCVVGCRRGHLRCSLVASLPRVAPLPPHHACLLGLEFHPHLNAPAWIRGTCKTARSPDLSTKETVQPLTLLQVPRRNRARAARRRACGGAAPPAPRPTDGGRGGGCQVSAAAAGAPGHAHRRAEAAVKLA